MTKFNSCSLNCGFAREIALRESFIAVSESERAVPIFVLSLPSELMISELFLPQGVYQMIELSFFRVPKA